MNKKINAPDYAVKAVLALEQNGFEAFFAGGCVRDSLIGREPEDWDIATSAEPEKVMAVFNGQKVIPTGIKHGTVSIVTNGQSIEITTYRVDGKYSDNRRPDSVTFTGNLRADLARRDFTINALAYHPEKGIVDYFNGTGDIRKGLIRCVGNPDARFGEDALRILRGARFACTLGFKVEDATLSAMIRLRGLLDRIAAERISKELSKAILGPGFSDFFLKNPEILTLIIPGLQACVGFDQHSKYHQYDVYSHIIHAVGNAPADMIIRLALLFHDMTKPECLTVDNEGEGHFYGHSKTGETAAIGALAGLRYDHFTVNRAALLIRYHDTPILPEARNVKRWLNKIGEEAFRQLLEVQRADNHAKVPSLAEKRLKDLRLSGDVLEHVLAEGQIFSLKDLAVDGGDLMSAGVLKGPAVGRMLDYLLGQVMDGRLENRKEILLEAVHTIDKLPT